PAGGSIRFGLSAVRHVGEGVVEKIIEARTRKGRFTSFFDFCRKVDYICLNKKTIESLIKAGAFESLGHTRRGLLDVYEGVTAEICAQRKQEEAGQFSLFGGGGGGQNGAAPHAERPIPMEEHPKRLLLQQEKEMLGLFVSDHPLLEVDGMLSRMCECSITSLETRTPGEVLMVGGMVSGLRKKVTKSGGIMVLLDLEDISGAAVEVIVFPTAQEKYGHLLMPDEILLVRGRLDRDARDDSVKMIAMEVQKPKLTPDELFRIPVPADRCSETLVDSLKEVLSNHPGSVQVELHLSTTRGVTKLRLDSQFSVDTSNGIHGELRALGLSPLSTV
ncbi:MAG: DNA polymerase III subunit alpha, partial [Actinomycetota bacterium]|nr:DNA polymerase III subunit alpha [Actinomycetota bacterium]